MLEREAIKGLDESVVRLSSPPPWFECNVNVFVHLYLYMPLHIWTGGRSEHDLQNYHKGKIEKQTTHSP